MKLCYSVKDAFTNPLADVLLDESLMFLDRELSQKLCGLIPEIVSLSERYKQHFPIDRNSSLARDAAKFACAINVLLELFNGRNDSASSTLGALALFDLICEPDPTSVDLMVNTAPALELLKVRLQVVKTCFDEAKTIERRPPRIDKEAVLTELAYCMRARGIDISTSDDNAFMIFGNKLSEHVWGAGNSIRNQAHSAIKNLDDSTWQKALSGLGTENPRNCCLKN